MFKESKPFRLHREILRRMYREGPYSMGSTSSSRYYWYGFFSVQKEVTQLINIGLIGVSTDLTVKNPKRYMKVTLLGRRVLKQQE